MKVKIGFMEGAEEWQIKVFLYRFRNIDPSILEFEIECGFSYCLSMVV